jgi:hypothetical protein
MEKSHARAISGYRAVARDRGVSEKRPLAASRHVPRAVCVCVPVASSLSGKKKRETSRIHDNVAK